MARYNSIIGVIDSEADIFQECLTDLYGEKDQPLCYCSPNQPKMYIAKISERYIIKRLPGTGILHDPSCESFELPHDLSGRGQLENKAIKHEGEYTDLKVEFSLSKTSQSRLSGGPSAPSTGDIKATHRKLGIISLFHFLYEEAQLNKWRPKMTGKRSWPVIRKHLLLAAKNKTVKKNNLDEILLIPETFNLERIEEIKSRRNAFIAKFKEKKNNKQKLGVLIGELKGFEKARFDYKMLIKHMPEKPIFMSEDVMKQLLKKYDKEIALFNEDETIHLMVIATFLISPSGNLQVDTISMITLDRHWLPFESLDEQRLIKQLVEQERSFIKCLRYNLNKDEPIASVLLIDTEKTTSITILKDGEAEENDFKENEAVDNVNWNNDIAASLQLPKKI